MYPVYLITCVHPTYGQCMMPYVGVVWMEGKTVEERFKQHINEQGGAKYLRNAVQKHGKEWFRVEQIDAGNTPEQALELEKWWIARLGTKAPNGYNITDGGRGAPGTKHTEEWMTQHLALHRGSKRSEQTRHRLALAWKARPPFSKETREKMSRSHEGKKRPQHAEAMRKVWAARKAQAQQND